MKNTRACSRARRRGKTGGEARRESEARTQAKGKEATAGEARRVGWQNHCRCPRCQTIEVGSGSVGVVTPAYVSRGHGEDKNKRSRADVSPIDISKFQK